MTYTEAKAMGAAIEARLKAASAAMPKGTGSGPMGLTPDAIKFSPEYRAAKLVVDRTMRELREFNRWFVPTFKKEISAEIRARRGQ